MREEVLHPRGARSMSSHLHSRLHLTGVKAGLLRECLSKEEFADLDTPVTSGDPPGVQMP